MRHLCIRCAGVDAVFQARQGTHAVAVQAPAGIARHFRCQGALLVITAKSGDIARRFRYQDEMLAIITTAGTLQDIRDVIARLQGTVACAGETVRSVGMPSAPPAPREPPQASGRRRPSAGGASERGRMQHSPCGFRNRPSRGVGK